MEPLWEDEGSLRHFGIADECGIDVGKALQSPMPSITGQFNHQN